MKTIRINNFNISPFILGSSPFCGAGQFGDKGEVFRKRFYDQPHNITEMLVSFIKKGHNCVHLLALPPFMEAAAEAYRILGREFPVLITLMPENQEEQWKWIKKVQTAALFLHGAETDKRRKDSIARFAENCRKNQIMPGAATHNTGETIPWLENNCDEVEIYMCPFNKTGLHVHPSLDKALEVLSEAKKIIIGMKVLACGCLSAKDAFRFSLPYVDAVTVGMVSKEEIEENCDEFKKYHHTLALNRRRI